MERKLRTRLGVSNAWLDEVGNFAAGRIWNHCRRIPFRRLAFDDIFRDELPRADHCGAAAERQGRGPRGRIRWRGQAERIRAAGRCDDTLPSDDVVRDHVHGVCDGFGIARRSLGRNGRLCDLQHEQTRIETGDNACSGNTGTGNSGASDAAAATASAGYDAAAAATATGADATPSEEIARFRTGCELRATQLN